MNAHSIRHIEAPAETVWAVRGFPQNHSLVSGNIGYFHENTALLPHPRSWFLSRIEKQLKHFGGLLRLVPLAPDEAEAVLLRDRPRAPVLIVWKSFPS
jgi:hypothetical protein